MNEQQIRKVAGLVLSGLSSLQDGAINNGIEQDFDFTMAEGALIEAASLLGYNAKTMAERIADRGAL